MLWNEFVEGTGCRDNEHNYKVYKDLEVMYMNSDMNKAEIYEYGKKLVDNSKSEKELEAEREIKEEITFWKNEIERFNREIAWNKEILEECKIEGNDELAWFRRNDIKYYKEQKKKPETKSRP